MDTLSDDILIHIFAQGTAKEISLWRRVSSTWNHLINDDFVWKRAFLNFWNNITPTSKISSWKEEYLQRIETINKMSCHKPLAIRICTKKTEIQDISITNSSIKVLNLTSLTSAIIKSDGRLDQKFILFFENVFGEAPITFIKFHKNGSLILGFADGSLIIFDKCPSKSLLENYKRIPSTLTSSPIKTVFFPFLTVHKTGNCYEFVNLKDQTILTIPELKEFCFIEEKLKIFFITNNGDFCSSSLNGGSRVLININIENKINLLQVNSDWLILTTLNRIFIISIESEEIIASFNTTISSAVKVITCNSQCIELLAVEKDTILRLKIDPIGNSLEIKKVEIFKEISGFFVNEFFYILVTIEGEILVHDTLTNRQINKCSYPKYFLKYHTTEDCFNAQEQVAISQLEENKFLFIWGKSLAQIWDFNPKISKNKKQTKTESDKDKDEKAIGSKETRKYSKYAINHGIDDYIDEKMEEDHLNHLRRNLNIEGLTEEELIAYAKLISKGEDGTSDSIDSVDFVDDPELEMVLKLSLTEM